MSGDANERRKCCLGHVSGGNRAGRRAADGACPCRGECGYHPQKAVPARKAFGLPKHPELYVVHVAGPAEQDRQHCARCGMLLEPDLAGRPGWETGETVLRVRTTNEGRLPGDPAYLIMTNEWLAELACEPQNDASPGGTPA